MLVFVYGTLTDRECADELLDDFSYAGTETLSGFHRVDGEYPTLAPGGSVGGRLLETDEIGRLDAYEGIDRGLYTRVPVPVEGAETPTRAAVYVGDPDRLDVEAPVEWPGDGPFADRVRRYFDRDGTVVRPEHSC